MAAGEAGTWTRSPLQHSLKVVCHLELSTDLREVFHCTVNITDGRLKGSLITKPPIGL